MAMACADAVVAQYSDVELVEELEAEHADLMQRLEQPLGLQECIEVALARNLRLAIARQQRDAVATGVTGTLGTWLPVLSFDTSFLNSRGELDSEVLGDVRELTGTSVRAALTQRLPLGGAIELLYGYDEAGDDLRGGYFGGVAFVQPLLRDAGWNKATASVQDARLARDAEAAELQAELLRVVFEVRSTFWEVVRRRQLIGVHQRAIARDQQLLAFSQAKVDAKLATRRDVLSAEIILAQDRGNLVNAQTGHRAALDDLADVLGVRIGTPLQLDSVAVELTPIPMAVEAWVETALARNPEILSARTELERLELQMQVAGNERLPRLDLGVRYDEIRVPIGPGDPTLRRREGRVWRGTVTFSYPILNKPRASAHKAAQIRHEQGRRLLLEAERQIVLQVRDSARNLERIEEQIEVLDKTIQGARDKVEFANVNFQLGRASNLDITDAQKDLVEAESDWVEEVANYYVERARLQALLGGSLE
jgi:outer membrane protein TolC